MTAVIDPRCPWVQVHDNPQAEWKCIAVRYQNENESSGNHNIYFTVLGSDGIVVSGMEAWHDWADGKDSETILSGSANIALYGGPFYPDRGERGAYGAWVGDRSNSDYVDGMGLPVNRHVNYFLVFRQVGAGTQPPITPPTTPPSSQDVLARVQRALQAALDDLNKPE